MRAFARALLRAWRRGGAPGASAGRVAPYGARLERPREDERAERSALADRRVDAEFVLSDEAGEARHERFRRRAPGQSEREIVDARSALECRRIERAGRRRARRSARYRGERSGRARSAERAAARYEAPRGGFTHRLWCARRLAKILGENRLNRRRSRYGHTVEQHIVRRGLAQPDGAAARDERARARRRVVARRQAPHERRGIELARAGEDCRSFAENDGRETHCRLRAAGQRERHDGAAVVVDAKGGRREGAAAWSIELEGHDGVALRVDVRDSCADLRGHGEAARRGLGAGVCGGCVHRDGAGELLRACSAPRGDSFRRRRYSARRLRGRRSDAR